jgi:heavy metal-binding protein
VIYTCPMHPEVREVNAGQCPKCGMALLPEGTRFALLRHMMTPLHLAIMAAVMIALMGGAMMLMR